MTRIMTKADAVAVFATKENGSPVKPELETEFRRALEAVPSEDPLVWASVLVAVLIRSLKKEPA